MESAISDPAIARTLAAVEVGDDPRSVIEPAAEGTRQTHERHGDLVYGLFYRNPLERPQCTRF
ncbi:hypothetical protein [Streptomyces chromofuscus]|uniref:hypothetical protein n=1 Tax=Streptomyces chromofuscus TaxID=42881 RepID=UPI0019C606DD|nr:hypothetical protein [Streptomyces chromofuscus]GGT02996.1 hypothetical protein GCM10010254_24140 [Streptomyces chromofuscus]